MLFRVSQPQSCLPAWPRPLLRREPQNPGAMKSMARPIVMSMSATGTTLRFSASFRVTRRAIPTDFPKGRTRGGVRWTARDAVASREVSDERWRRAGLSPPEPTGGGNCCGKSARFHRSVLNQADYAGPGSPCFAASEGSLPGPFECLFVQLCPISWQEGNSPPLMPGRNLRGFADIPSI